jgi:hypothetical protein
MLTAPFTFEVKQTAASMSGEGHGAGYDKHGSGHGEGQH